MLEVFFESFFPVLKAVSKIGLISVVAGIIVRKNYISRDSIKGLSALTINVLLPCMIFSNILRNFNPQEFDKWWILPLSAVAMIIIGLLAGVLLFLPKASKNKNLIALGGLMNAGYLVLPIGQVVFPETFDKFALYTFLFILGFSPLLWSLGKFLATSDNGDGDFSWKGFITPPLLANIIGVSLVLLNIGGYVPEMIIDSTDFMGEATVPVATFILGATLGGISFRKWPKALEIAKVISVKFILIPVVTLITLYLLDLRQSNPLLTDILIIESASAPAANIIIMIRKYGGDEQKVGSMMVISYVVCMLAIPTWLAVCRVFLM